MNNKHHTRLAGMLLFLLGTTLHAASPVVPSMQPAIVAGKYTLEKTSLAGGTLAYRPFFESSTWQGDIIQYEIDASGKLFTDARIGSYTPVVAGTSGGCGKTAPAGCWMARATFNNKVAGTVDYWKQIPNGRHIFTYGDTDNDGAGDTQVDFLWSHLSPVQRVMLDPTTATDPAVLTGAYDSPVLNFIRGDNSNEKSSGGIWRNRHSLLGDIMNSWPVYIGPPGENYTLPGFIDFRNRHSGAHRRTGRIAVGANDGMLHMFEAEDGAEVYAYVPSMLLGKLDRLTISPDNNARHTRYVDGRITSVSARIRGHWMSVLSAGLGAGGAGLFALDVTSPDPDNHKILFELTGNDIGHIHSQPSIVRLADGHWYIVTGNGYGTGGSGKLLQISLDDGSYSSIPTGVSAGLSGATVVDTDSDGDADVAFAGDADGNMWKFYLGNSPPATNPKRIYRPPASTGNTQPITTRPDIGVHPLGGYMVLFGTGSMTRPSDASDKDYPTQALYGIRDSGPGTVIIERTLSEISHVTFSSVAGSNTESVRYMAGRNVPDYQCETHDSSCGTGWKISLPHTGERVAGPPQLRNGRMIVVTTNPLDSRGGNSWLMSVDYLTGGDHDTLVLNLNGDSELDSRDTVAINHDESSEQRIPVGLHLGNGLFSQPTLANIGPGVDAIFINGLHMSSPENSNKSSASADRPAEVHDLTSGPGTALNRRIPGPDFMLGRRSWIDLQQ